jgi:hypothetical protein
VEACIGALLAENGLGDAGSRVARVRAKFGVVEFSVAVTQGLGLLKADVSYTLLLQGVRAVDGARGLLRLAA